MCGAFGVLPISFALTGKLERIAEHPSAGGGSANVFKAIYEEQAVAVKALRIDTGTDPRDTRMVCSLFVHHPNSPHSTNRASRRRWWDGSGFVTIISCRF